jgi:hypothetical protein
MGMGSQCRGVNVTVAITTRTAPTSRPGLRALLGLSVLLLSVSAAVAQSIVWRSGLAWRLQWRGR